MLRDILHSGLGDGAAAPQLRQVCLCLDNDDAGHVASERMTALLKEHGLNAVRLVPQRKDWNDDLTADQEIESERSTLCQTFC
ncbi:MAG: toprim domain-containing protein [Lachnospiraceae bacterium]